MGKVIVEIYYYFRAIMIKINNKEVGELIMEDDSHWGTGNDRDIVISLTIVG